MRVVLRFMKEIFMDLEVPVLELVAKIDSFWGFFDRPLSYW